MKAVVFCYGFQKITPFCDFRSEMPFPVRTFLFLAGSDRSSHLYVNYAILFVSQFAFHAVVLAVDFLDIPFECRGDVLAGLVACH